MDSFLGVPIIRNVILCEMSGGPSPRFWNACNYIRTGMAAVILPGPSCEDVPTKLVASLQVTIERLQVTKRHEILLGVYWVGVGGGAVHAAKRSLHTVAQSSDFVQEQQRLKRDIAF